MIFTTICCALRICFPCIQIFYLVIQTPSMQFKHACMIRYCIAIHSKSGKNFQLTVIYSDLSQPTVASPEGTLQMLTTACAGHVVTNMHQTTCISFIGKFGMTILCHTSTLCDFWSWKLVAMCVQHIVCRQHSTVSLR